MAMRTVNPYTGLALETYEEHTDAEIDELLDAVRDAQRAWATQPVAQRVTRLEALAGRLREQADALARLMAAEMGKPLAEGRAEVEKCAWVCEYYAETGPAFLAHETIETDATASYVAYRPLGTVLAIMPWNFPLWQVMRFAVPGVTAGNGAVLKHAEASSGMALRIEALFREAGYPPDLLRALLVSNERVAQVIADPRVAAVTLTGSTRAGRAVAETAGHHLKKTVLELGGSDAYLVLDDAPLEATVEACATSRLVNGGQSCIAAKRFIVTPGIRPAFEAALVARMRRAVMGDPTDPDVTLGPQARGDLRDGLHRQVTESVHAGARVLLGGERPSGRGFLYPATVLTDVAPGMPAFGEELFGPVAAIVPADSEADAVALANRSCYGLGAAVFTADRARGERLAVEELEAGSCFVNAFVRSDPRLPFGGIKHSGYGRELSRVGMREFVNVKTVYVA